MSAPALPREMTPTADRAEGPIQKPDYPVLDAKQKNGQAFALMPDTGN